MKFKFLIYTASIFVLLFGIWGFYTFRYRNSEKPVDESRTVYIKKTENGYRLYRNGEPFYIKGAGGDSYFKELADIGGNTIRLYDTLQLLDKLDEAHKYNLAVIVDIPLYRFDTDYNPYLIDKDVAKLKESVQTLVKNYKSHPALLMWNLGNEIQYPVVIQHPRIAGGIKDVKQILKVLSQRKNFIRTFNELITFIHTEDPNHPVTTSVATNKFWKKLLNIHVYSPEIDVIGYNIFAPPAKFKTQTGILSRLLNMKPFYISEWGMEGPWAQEKTFWGAPIETTSTNKGVQYVENYRFFTENFSKSLGTAVFYWGQKQERTHTWFNIFDESGKKSQVYYELRKLWNTDFQSQQPPQLKYMLIEDKGAKNNLVFYPNEIKTAQVLFNEKADSTFKIRWEIHEEGWNYEGKGAKHKPTKEVSGRIDKTNANEVIFRAPTAEGPYRIFAIVFDEHDNFATTNTPFYVLNNDKYAPN